MILRGENKASQLVSKFEDGSFGYFYYRNVCPELYYVTFAIESVALRPLIPKSYKPKTQTEFMR